MVVVPFNVEIRWANSVKYGAQGRRGIDINATSLPNAARQIAAGIHNCLRGPPALLVLYLL
jgi:hypothetical protein